MSEAPFAIIQMCSQSVIEDNLEHAAVLLARAAEAGAALAVLPENFAALGRRDARQLAHAEARGQGPILPWLRRQARELGLWLVAGTLPLPDDHDPSGKPRACCLVFDANGERVARYDKLHLFDADVHDSQSSYRESNDYAPGEQVVVVDTPAGRLGLSVCYDLRFPALYTALRQAGAELISVPSAFTRVTGEAHWEVLLRARAIETQCYILAAAQGGWHSEQRQTHGHGAIIDPWGQVVGQLQREAGFLLGQRDPEAQTLVRRQMPVMQHQRFARPVL